MAGNDARAPPLGTHRAARLAHPIWYTSAFVDKRPSYTAFVVTPARAAPQAPARAGTQGQAAFVDTRPSHARDANRRGRRLMAHV